MKFSALLTKYRTAAGIKKIDLARLLGLKGSTYIINLEKGRDTAPTFTRCREIAKILRLDHIETKEFIDTAMEERLDPETLDWLGTKFSPDVIDALSDPVAVKALLVTFRNKEDIKRVLHGILETLPGVDPEKKKAILRIC